MKKEKRKTRLHYVCSFSPLVFTAKKAHLTAKCYHMFFNPKASIPLWKKKKDSVSCHFLVLRNKVFLVPRTTDCTVHRQQSKDHHRLLWHICTVMRCSVIQCTQWYGDLNQNTEKSYAAVVRAYHVSATTQKFQWWGQTTDSCLAPCKAFSRSHVRNSFQGSISSVRQRCHQDFL